MKRDRTTYHRTGAVIANWNSGVASSGQPGADLVILGMNGVPYTLRQLLISIANLTGGAVIDIRLYTIVRATERNIGEDTWTVGIDPDGLWLLTPIDMANALRIEAYSDQAGDDGRSMEYDYLQEPLPAY
jgi:hypothetical protein